MTLAPGTRIGPYEIIDVLGAGGMGEVYRARDTKLNRDVAIKVLPALFAADPDRLSRFEREAQTLAALNHPHIAQIHGVIEHPAALVMECVEGEDLAQRIAHGRIPVDEALQIARQIADALEVAHERGIVHRDLKPANIKVSPEGDVKVLDFGLAKATEPQTPAGAAALENSPTFTSPVLMTQAGVILGTAAYMSPEQARGKSVDRRADIWAFGCVLYEMLSGGAPFEGDSITDVLSAIISREPDWTRLPPAPTSVQRLLRRCLEKDPRRRLRDIGEARVTLEQPTEQAHAGSNPPRLAPAWLTTALGALVALLTLAVVALLIRTMSGDRDGAHPALTRYDVQLPGNAAVNIVFRPAVSVSADGSTFAFVGAAEGINRIYLRSRGEVAPHVVAGTEGGTSPALSPDGRWVAFFADGTVRKAGRDGGVVTLGPARDVRGATWSDSSTLVLTLDSASALVRMSAMGGDARTITNLATGERTHRWPDALPGGKAVLFTVGTLDKPDVYDQANIDAVMLATGERRVIVNGAAMARYCGNGHLVYSKGTSLYAVPFDADQVQVTGAPVEVIQGVERDPSTGAAHFDCGDEGTLAFVPGSAAGDQHQLTWMDRDGRGQPANLPPGPYQEVRVSPDGTRVALLSGTSGNGDVWIYEVADGTFTRLTFNGTSAAPIWSADGRTVYYTAFDPSGKRSTIARKPADGSREAETLRSVEGRAYLASVDEAQTTAILDAIVAASDRGDILRVPLAASATPQPLVATRFNEYASNVSPNWQWLAYESDETGRPEVYVRDLRGSGARWQVTSAGGEEPHWSGDGRELYYRTANRLMAVPILQGQTFRSGNPRPIFDGIYNSGIESGRSYDVDPKTGRFLLVRPVRDVRVSGSVRIVLNWDANLTNRPR
ncbi:MAG: protein kinase domain-containing protein [Acidobacteriota bacterium]